MSLGLEDTFKTFIEDPLDKLGLLDNRPLRFGVATGLTLATVNFIKPAAMYDANGRAKKSILLDRKQGIYFEPITFSLFIGAMSILFI